MTGNTLIRNERLTAEISALGAELQVLRTTEGTDFLWNGDPAWWRGRSPLLFPIVGRVPDDTVRIDGKSYTMHQHGIVRTETFALAASEEAACTFRLSASDATRAAYPFEFVLDVRYAVEGAGLLIESTVTNAGDREMPVSFGYHPAFVWPLPGATGREGHLVTFDAPEPAPIRRVKSGLLQPESFPTPVEGRVMRLEDALFVDDAVIFDRLASRAVTFSGPNGASVRVEFEGMPQLGIWTKPGAPYLCIEPWHGYAAPQGFDGELRDKEAMTMLAPGKAMTFAIRVTVSEG